MVSTPESPVCAGAPLDAEGRARNAINDCPFPCSHVVVGQYPDHHGQPITVMATTCSLHRRAVEAFVGEHDPETCVTAEIAALPAIVEHLTSEGEDVFWMEHRAAA